jgi:serine protease Do
VQQTEQGLVVADATGPAARAGVEAGDVILAVNDQPVKSVEQLRRLVDKAGKHVALLVQREDAKVYVPVDLG